MVYGQMLVVGGVALACMAVCAWLGVFLGPRHERARRLFAAIGAPVLLALFLFLSLRAVRNGVVSLDAMLPGILSLAIVTTCVAGVGFMLALTIWSVRQGRGRAV